MSLWKSRWSTVRLVKPPLSKRTPSSLPCTRAWEEVSITQAPHPFSAILYSQSCGLSPPGWYVRRPRPYLRRRNRRCPAVRLDARIFKYRFCHEGRCGLAVRTRQSYHLQLFRRFVVKQGCDYPMLRLISFEIIWGIGRSSLRSQRSAAAPDL